MLDQAVGVFALVAIVFVVLLTPSTLAVLGGHRRGVLMSFDAILILVAPGLLLAPYLAPILERWRFTRWAGMLAHVTHETFLGSAWGTLIFVVAFGTLLLSIASPWPIGRLLGLGLSISDAAVLIILMAGIALILILISGWGVGEVAVSKLLRSRGILIAMRCLNLIPKKAFSFIFTWLLSRRLTDNCETKVLRRIDYQSPKARGSYFGDFDSPGDFDLIFRASKLNLNFWGFRFATPPETIRRRNSLPSDMTCCCEWFCSYSCALRRADARA